jgi:hypothetical protein
MSVEGRNKESTWVYMVSNDNISGWVFTSLLTIEGEVSRISVRSVSDALSLAPTVTATFSVKEWLNTKSTSTPQSIVRQIVPLCSDLSSQLGEHVLCRIERAYCDYRPDIDGSPTFCNDRPYPSHNFTLVAWEENWSDLDGSCILISGNLKTYRGVLQIQALNRSQVSYCE